MNDRFRVVIAGGGVAALEATLALRALAEERLAIELIAPDTDFVYRPLSVAEPFRVADTRTFPLAPLAEAAGGSLFRGRIAAVDPGERKIVTETDEEREYDALLVALGARPLEAISGALTFSGPQSMEGLKDLLDDVLSGEVRRIAFALPTGVTWPLPLYELALLTGSYITDHFAGDVDVVLVTPEDRPWRSLVTERARPSPSCSRGAASRSISAPLPAASRTACCASPPAARLKPTASSLFRVSKGRGWRGSRRTGTAFCTSTITVESAPRWTCSRPATRRTSR